MTYSQSPSRGNWSYILITLTATFTFYLFLPLGIFFTIFFKNGLSAIKTTSKLLRQPSYSGVFFERELTAPWQGTL